jgi:hypothetical protein
LGDLFHEIYEIAPAWSFDMAMLAVLALLYAGFVRWKIRLTAGGK